MIFVTVGTHDAPFDRLVCAAEALGGTLDPLKVWLGATLALIGLSALGVWVGRTYLQRLPMMWLHRLSGLVFLGVGSLAAWRALT